MHQRKKRYLPSRLALGALLVLAAGARTERSVALGAAANGPIIVEPTGESVPASAASAPAVAARRAAPTAGVRAFIDPATGELTADPSPQQLRALALAPRAAFSRSMTGLRPFELDSGGRGVNLQGRFASALRVQVAPDGTFRMTCGDPAHESTPHSHDGDTSTVSPQASSTAPPAAGSATSASPAVR